MVLADSVPAGAVLLVVSVVSVPLSHTVVMPLRISHWLAVCVCASPLGSLKALPVSVGVRLTSMAPPAGETLLGVTGATCSVAKAVADE